MLFNTVLFFINIVIVFSLIILLEKLLKKEGLYLWIVLATIIANIEVTKVVSMLGFEDCVTLGNISFASIFLATDVLSVKYGYKEAKKGVYIGLATSIIFLCLMQLDLLYIPSASDYVNESLKVVFGLDGIYIWVVVASVSMFFVANLLDVWLFDKLRKKLTDKHLWLTNNVATIISNCLENFLFVILGYFVLQFIFTGQTIYSLEQCLQIAGTTCLIETIIAVIDTPFLYLAKKKCKGDIEWQKQEDQRLS